MGHNIFKEIDIATPIWKNRSVGLAVDDVPMGQHVKVTISYRRKGSGELAYPGEYIINVDEIRKFPVENIKGSVRVYIVPIIELAKLTLFSNNQNQSNMLFGSQELGKIIKESEEAKSNAGSFDNKKFLEPGKHLMTLSEVTLENAKSDGNAMVVVEFTKDDEHRSIRSYMKIAGPNTDISREQLVRLFHRGFNYAIQPCKTDKDLMDQLVKFKGQKLTVAVKGKKQAYAFEKDGKDIVMEVIRPEFWYAGMTSEFDDFYIDMQKAIVELSQEDKEKLVRFAEINGGPYIPKEKAEATNTSALPPSNDTGSIAPAPAQQASAPLQNASEKIAAKPIENVEAQPQVDIQGESPAFDWEKKANEAPATPAPQPEAQGTPTEDDGFPF